MDELMIWKVKFENISETKLWIPTRYSQQMVPLLFNSSLYSPLLFNSSLYSHIRNDFSNKKGSVKVYV